MIPPIFSSPVTENQPVSENTPKPISATIPVKGEIYSCSFPNFKIKSDNIFYDGQIKGKKLKGIVSDIKELNPLCCGDFVDIAIYEDQKASIISRNDRKNVLYRYNRNKLQSIAANIDKIVYMTSFEFDEFDYIFLDKITVLSMYEKIELVIVINKTDLYVDNPLSKKDLDFVDYYKKKENTVFYLSAKTGEGIEAFKDTLKDKKILFIGKSGVGKSSLVNQLVLDANQTTEFTSKSLQGGRHTTVLSLMFDADGFKLIDTPGIKDLNLSYISKENLGFYFFDFLSFLGNCQYNSCLHKAESNCAIKKAVEDNIILKTRYKSYLTLLYESN